MRMLTFKPEIPYLDDDIENLIKDMFAAYNAVLGSPLGKVNRQDLSNLKSVIEMLRSFHCAIAHNENKKYENESRRTMWIELHHTIFMQIRNHINDLQDDKTVLDFTAIHQSVRDLVRDANALITRVLHINLQQNFYARVQFYKYHKRAIALQCAIHHIFLPSIENGRTAITESAQAMLYKRAADLHDSFQDSPHPLHMPDEKIPHITFIPL